MSAYIESEGLVVDSSGNMQLAPIHVPEPGPREVLIEVKAAGVNRADILQRQGKYPPPSGASPIIGLEASGIIEQAGAEVEGWKIGDEVFSLLSGGGYAKHCVADSGLLWRKPKEWSFSYAAAIPEGLFTAFLNLVLEADLSVGERVFIEGGSGGVGTFAVQIAKRLGAYVVASAGSDEHAARVRDLGANECINHKTSSPAGDFDVILSIMGASNLEANLKRLNIDGRLVMIAAQGGIDGKLDLRELMRRRARVIGSVLRARDVEEKEQIKRQIDLILGEAVMTREIRAVVDSVLTLDQANQAHAKMLAGEHFGKLVLEI